MNFKITRANENKFESGLRCFFEYKNLGIEEATSGNVGANVIKAIEGKHANGEWHDGKILEGIDAFLLIWSQLPRYKWLYNFIKLPLIYHMSHILYEVLAFALYLKNRNQISNERSRN